ncbi:MAG: hypothetical protein HZC11_04630 [Nitrospirae bacterium]|nr:hypothetical protein [Nitrospirota bacterium]
MTEDRPKVSEEQISYANILNIGMWLGLLVLVVTFIIYVSGILQSFIPVEELPKYWGMKAKDYIHTLNAPTGWGWVSLIGKGDYLNFVGIVFLAGLTIICYLAILPILIRKKKTPFVVISIIEVAVLILAASGILKAGGH